MSSALDTAGKAAARLGGIAGLSADDALIIVRTAGKQAVAVIAGQSSS